MREVHGWFVVVLVVDPEIRILDNNHQIFVLHPGDKKRFYNDFVETSSVFLDLPGISFPEPPSIDDEHIRNALRMSRQISSWRRHGGKEADKPSRNPADYAIANPGLQAPRFVREVKDLYADAKAGDLVVVPGDGYRSLVYFGEFENDFDPEFNVEARRYRLETIPARRVKWLPRRLMKGQVPEKLLRLLQNRQALIRVSQIDERHQFYEMAYGDYVWGDTSGNMIQITKQEVDLRDLSRAVDLTNFFAAQYIALKQGRLEEFLKLGFHEGTERFYDKTYFGGVSIEVHSPGYFGRSMNSAALAGYVSIMLALSATQVAPGDAANLVVENSANAVVSICDQELEADVRETMDMYINFNLWETDICPRRQASEADVGLQTDTKVRHRDDNGR